MSVVRSIMTLRRRARPRDDHGSTIPLIIGFFLIAAYVSAGAVAAGDAFVQQRSLQDMCDGIATSAAASAVDLDRAGGVVSGGALRFTAVEQAIADYTARDPARRDVRTDVQLGDDARTLTVRCTEHTTIVFGPLFGRAGGVDHHVVSSARAPVT